MSERMESLLTEMVSEQRKTNQLLAMLIEAMAEAEGEGEAPEPDTYLDGRPVR